MRYLRLQPAPVIECQLSDLVARCVERGYALDDVISCIISRDGDSITVDEMHPSYPRPRPGLGDMVAIGLGAVGITKARVEAVVGGPCGCSERQAAINAMAAKYLGFPPGLTAAKNKG